MRTNFLNCVKEYSKEGNYYDASYYTIRKGKSLNATIFSGNFSRGLTKTEINSRLSALLNEIGGDLLYNNMNINRINVYQNPEILSELVIIIEV